MVILHGEWLNLFHIQGGAIKFAPLLKTQGDNKIRPTFCKYDRVGMIEFTPLHSGFHCQTEPKLLLPTLYSSSRSLCISLCQWKMVFKSASTVKRSLQLAFGFLTSQKTRNAASKLSTNCRNSKVGIQRWHFRKWGFSETPRGEALYLYKICGALNHQGNLSDVTGEISFMFSCLCILMFCMIFHPCILKHSWPGGSMFDCCMRAVSSIPGQNCSELFDLYYSMYHE